MSTAGASLPPDAALGRPAVLSEDEGEFFDAISDEDVPAEGSHMGLDAGSTAAAPAAALAHAPREEPARTPSLSGPTPAPVDGEFHEPVDDFVDAGSPIGPGTLSPMHGRSYNGVNAQMRAATAEGAVGFVSGLRADFDHLEVSASSGEELCTGLSLSPPGSGGSTADNTPTHAPKPLPSPAGTAFVPTPAVTLAASAVSDTTSSGQKLTYGFAVADNVGRPQGPALAVTSPATAHVPAPSGHSIASFVTAVGTTSDVADAFTVPERHRRGGSNEGIAMAGARPVRPGLPPVPPSPLTATAASLPAARPPSRSALAVSDSPRLSPQLTSAGSSSPAPLASGTLSDRMSPTPSSGASLGVYRAGDASTQAGSTPISSALSARVRRAGAATTPLKPVSAAAVQAAAMVPSPSSTGMVRPAASPTPHDAAATLPALRATAVDFVGFSAFRQAPESSREGDDSASDDDASASAATAGRDADVVTANRAGTDGSVEFEGPPDGNRLPTDYSGARGGVIRLARKLFGRPIGVGMRARAASVDASAAAAASDSPVPAGSAQAPPAAPAVAPSASRKNALSRFRESASDSFNTALGLMGLLRPRVAPGMLRCQYKLKDVVEFTGVSLNQRLPNIAASVVRAKAQQARARARAKRHQAALNSRRQLPSGSGASATTGASRGHSRGASRSAAALAALSSGLSRDPAAIGPEHRAAGSLRGSDEAGSQEESGSELGSGGPGSVVGSIERKMSDRSVGASSVASERSASASVHSGHQDTGRGSDAGSSDPSHRGSGHLPAGSGPRGSASDAASEASAAPSTAGRRVREAVNMDDVLSGPVTEAIWSMKFSVDGAYLGVAGGSDTGAVVRVWKVRPWADAPVAPARDPSTSTERSLPTLPSVGDITSASRRGSDSSVSGTNTATASAAQTVQSVSASQVSTRSVGMTSASSAITGPSGGAAALVTHGPPLIESRPFREYLGHDSHVVDIAWSRSNLLLSASMDGYVRLWHVSRSECLHKFQHPDCVTSVCFHPSEDNYFVTGCLDKKLRVWSLETGRVVLWQATTSMITSVAFSPDARFVVAGQYNGVVTFYLADGLRYHTQVECRNRRGRHKHGRKVTGIDFTPTGSHALVTTNDSRIRLISLHDFSIAFKYVGLRNNNMQIRASFGANGERIVSGSEDRRVIVWRTRNDQYTPAINPRVSRAPKDHVRSVEWFVAEDGNQPPAPPPAKLCTPKPAVDTGSTKGANPACSSAAACAASPGRVDAPGRAPPPSTAASASAAPPALQAPSSAAHSAHQSAAPGALSPMREREEENEEAEIEVRAELAAYAAPASGRVATTVAIFAPPATLALARPPERILEWMAPQHAADLLRQPASVQAVRMREVLQNHFLIVAGDSRGFLRIYENSAPRRVL